MPLKLFFLNKAIILLPLFTYKHIFFFGVFTFSLPTFLFTKKVQSFPNKRENVTLKWGLETSKMGKTLLAAEKNLFSIIRKVKMKKNKKVILGGQQVDFAVLVRESN